MAWEMNQGDRERDLFLICKVNGVPQDISDATGATLVWHPPDGSRVEYALALTLPAQGIVKYAWQAGDPSDVGGPLGVHEMSVRVRRGNGEDQTFPSDASRFRVRVNPRP